MTTLEDFENGDLSNYSGSTSKLSVVNDSSTAYEGDYYLDGEHGDYSYYGIGRDDLTLSSGNLFRFHVYFWTTSDYSIVRHWFCDKQPAEDEKQGYHVQTSGSGGNLVLRKNDGTSTNLASDDSVSYSSGTWYRLDIDWGSSGSITVTLYDDNDNQVTEISATDTAFSSGALGWNTFHNGGYVDLVEENPDSGSAPTAPSNLSATLSD